VLLWIYSLRRNPIPPLVTYMSAPSPSSTPAPAPTSSTTISVEVTPLPTQLTTVPTLNQTQVIQQEEIIIVLQKYFEVYYQALSISPPEDFQEMGFGDLISDLPEARDFEEIEIAKLRVQGKYWELKNLRYSDYKHSLDYDNFTLDEAANLATVSLLDRAEVVRENSLENNPEDPHVTYREFRHIFVLRKERGEWKIISDTYWDSWWQQFRKPGSSKEDILSAMNLKMQEYEKTPSPTP